MPRHGEPPDRRLAPGQGSAPPGQLDSVGYGPGDASNRPGRAFYFHQDHLESTSAIADDEGEIHEHLQYLPDGDIWIDGGPKRPVNGYRFCGKPSDPETGFYDLGQRVYDPKTSL